MKYCSRGANPKTKRVLHSRLKNNITAVKGGVAKQPKEESRRIIDLPLITGSLSVCMPLRNSDFLEYVDFLEDLLKSTKSQGLDMLRVIAFLELAILCETVWKTELPSSYLDIMRVPQLAQKKARVTLNAIGIINGVGIDSHVKRFFTKVLGYGYSTDKLDALLDLLDTQTAANVNDNIAEIGQKLRNVKKKGKHWNHDRLWLAEVFDDLGSINKEMRDLCSHWLDVYEIVSLKAIN